MLIVFGTYSFNIKKYSSSELGIETETGDIPILLRQRVFHIFYIPVLPIGRLYAMQLSDGKLYNLPAHLHAAVDARGPHRTPFYAFALPLLVIAGLIISQCLTWKHRYDRTQLYQAAQREQADSTAARLDRLGTEHYIKLLDITDRYSGGHTYLHVRNVNGSAVTLERLDASLHEYNDNSPWNIRRMFLLQGAAADTITLPIQQLREANVGAYEDDVKDYKVPDLLHDGKRYRISDILSIPDGPMLATYGEDDTRDTMSPLMLTNYGTPLTLVSIRSADPSVRWLDVLPLTLTMDTDDTYTPLDIKGDRSTAYSATLTFEDEQKRRYLYDISWNTMNWELTQKSD